MGLRDKINANQNAVVVAAVVIIAVAGIYILMHMGGSRVSVSGKAWYYDTVTKEYFIDKADQFPPIDHDGHPAVRAHYFACGDCGNKSERMVGFYDKYTDEAKKKLEEARNSPNADQMGMEMYYENGVQYSIDGEKWYGPASTEYQTELEKHLNCPGGGRAKYCRVK